MLKKFGRRVSTGALGLFLLLLALVSALVIVFGTATHIKIALKTSNIYGTFVNNALDQAQNTSDSQTTEVSLKQPAVRAAAQIAFPPSLIQKSAENGLDGIYGWLQGKTQTPQFAINLSTAKQTFANQVGDAAAQRIQGLPVCTLSQLQTLDTSSIDLFSLPCKPPGVDLEAQRQQLVADLANNKNFLDKPVITADTLPKNDQGQTVIDQASKAPKVYRRLMILPWIIGLLVLICAGAVIFLHENKRRGLRGLAISFGIIAIILGFSIWIESWLFNKLSTDPRIVSNNTALQRSGIGVANHLSHDVGHVMAIFALCYVLVTVILLGIWWWLGKKEGHQKPLPVSKDSPSASPKEN